MTEASIDSNLDLGSDLDVAEDIYPDRTTLSTAVAYSNIINSNPRPLTDYTFGNKNLNHIAMNIQSLLTAEGNIRYDLNSRKDLLKIFSSFVEGVLNESEKQKETSQIIQPISPSKDMTISSLNSPEKFPTSSLQFDPNQTTIMSAQEKFETKLLISSQNEQIKSLKEQILHLEEERFSENLRQDYQAAIQSKDELLDRVMQKNSHLKNKIEAQKEIILKLQDLNTSNQLKIQKLEVEKQQMEAKIKGNQIHQNNSNNLEEQHSRSQKRIIELQKTIDSLTNLYEKQVDDLVKSREINHRSFQLLNDQNLVIDAFNIICTNSQNESSNSSNELFSLRDSNQRLTNQLQKMEADRESSDKIVAQIQKMLNDYFNASIQNIPETLQVVLTEGDPLLKQKNRKLKQIIKGQINFIQKFAETGEFDQISIEPSKKTKGKTIKNLALTEINRCQKFLRENHLMTNEDFKQAEGSNEKHLSFQIAVNDILRKECEKREKYKELLSRLKSSLDVSEEDDVAEIIQSRIDMNFNFLNNAIEIMKLDANSDPDIVYQAILVYLKQLTSIYEICDGKLRRIIRFEGSASDVPSATIDYIKKLKKDKTKEITNIKNDSSGLRSELEDSKIRVIELEKQLELKEKENSNLKIENVNFSSEFGQSKANSERENSSLKDQNTILLKQLQTANSKIESLTHEIIKLQSKYEESQRDFQLKLKTAIQEEEFNATVTIENMKNKARQDEAKLKEKLRLCSKKIQSLKSRNEELVGDSVSMTDKQKIIIEEMQKQVNALNDKIGQIKKEKDEEFKLKQDENRAVITSLQSEIKVLKNEVNALTIRCQQIETAKDNYWKAQLSNVEAKLKAKLQNFDDNQKTQHNSFLYRAAAPLTKLVPRFGAMNDESFVEYMNKVADALTEYETRLQQLQARFLRGEFESK